MSHAKFYQERIAEHGLTYQAVWGDDADWKATERFRIIEKGDLSPEDEIVDLGAGIGLLKAYLDEQRIPADYLAVDAVPQFLSVIKNNYHCVCLETDFFQNFSGVPEADWYTIFGSLNKKWSVDISSDDAGQVYSWLGECFKKARKGLYLSAFSDRADKPKPANIHLNPFRIIEELGSQAKDYRIRHDTGFYEFTLMVRK